MAPLTLPFTTLDVFTRKPFHGNQLAIIHLTTPIPQATKQAIAREFAFSESVFLTDLTADPTPTPPGTSATLAPTHRLETFTPSEELPFAGHPTIGTVHYLLSSREASFPSTFPNTPKIRIQTSAGVIYGSYFPPPISMAYASLPHSFHLHAASVPIRAILSSQPVLLGMAGQIPDAPLVTLVEGLSFALVDLTQHGLAALGQVRSARQRIEDGAVKMDGAEGAGSGRGDGDGEGGFVGVYYFVILNQEGQKFKIRTRMVEQSGEDAATGSAASCLAGFLALREGRAYREDTALREGRALRSGRKAKAEGEGPEAEDEEMDDEEEGPEYLFELEQGVEFGRASEISVAARLTVDGSGVDRVGLMGPAVMVTEGTIRVPED